MNEETVIGKSTEELKEKYGDFDQPVKVTVNRAGVHVDLKSAFTHPRMRYYLDLMKAQDRPKKNGE